MNVYVATDMEGISLIWKPEQVSPSSGGEYEYGEIAQEAFYAASFGVPFVFCSGDRAGCQEAARQFPGLVTAEVKHAVKRNAASCVSGEVARKRIADGVRQALARAKEIEPVVLQTPITVELTMYRTDMVDDYMNRRTVERVDGRTIRTTVDSMRDILRF